MHIGKYLLIKNEGKIQEGIVEQIFEEDLQIRLKDGTLIMRKFWEVRGIPKNEEKD